MVRVWPRLVCSCEASLVVIFIFVFVFFFFFFCPARACKCSLSLSVCVSGSVCSNCHRRSDDKSQAVTLTDSIGHRLPLLLLFLLLLSVLSLLSSDALTPQTNTHTLFFLLLQCVRACPSMGTFGAVAIHCTLPPSPLRRWPNLFDWVCHAKRYVLLVVWWWWWWCDPTANHHCSISRGTGSTELPVWHNHGCCCLLLFNNSAADYCEALHRHCSWAMSSICNLVSIQ